MNSHAKGKRGEREAAKCLRAYGIPARRGRQYKGTQDSPDVVVDGYPGVYVEVKRRQRLNVEKVLSQARDEAGAQQFPFLLHRRDSPTGTPARPVSEQWVVSFYLSDAERFCDFWQYHQTPEGCE